MLDTDVSPVLEVRVSPTPEPEHKGAVMPDRRPTADPHRFLIAAEELPPALLARIEAAELAVAPPRAAATVVLMRESRAGPETLLLRRPRRSSFAAGAWVFPGGVVDVEDRHEPLAPYLRGPPPEAWARRLALADPAEARGYVVAALREVWEETGILLLAEGDDPLPSTERLRRARAELLAGRLSLAELACGERLRLDAENLLYIAHWITPEPEPRRYDTRFFLARLPPAAVCELQGGELTEARWCRPEAALEEYHAGSLSLLPPTVHTLRRLTGYSSLEALWQALRDAPVPTFLPRMRREPCGVVVEIPFDE